MNHQQSFGSPLVWGILILWFLAIAALAHIGVFQTPGNHPPLFLLMAAMLPATLFWLIYRQSASLRRWVQTLDLGLVTIVQTWRVIGITFLFLWGLGELPGVFSAPAGFGDLAVGIVAAFTTLSVVRRSDNWKKASYWLIAIGMLDFVAAFGTAILSDTGRPLNFAGAPSSHLMQELPMALIPAYGVPFFIILHLIAWLKLRSDSASGETTLDETTFNAQG